MDRVPRPWGRVVRGGAPVAVAAGLGEPRTRDALLRGAAVRDGWMALAAAAQESGVVARQAARSRRAEGLAPALRLGMVSEVRRFARSHRLVKPRPTTANTGNNRVAY